jgi:hypothetical protein
MPEAHAEKCAQAIKAKAQKDHKTQAHWALDSEKKEAGSASKPGASLEKDRAKARERLKEQIKSKSDDRTGKKKG